MNSERRTVRRPMSASKAMLALADHLEIGLCVLSEQGMTLLENDALGRYLAQDQELGAVRERLDALVADRMQRRQYRPSESRSLERLAQWEETIAGCGVRCRVSGGEPGVFTDEPAVLLTIEPAAQPLPLSGISPLEGHPLTKTQTRVAMLMAKGRTNKQIAAALGVSLHTARNHTKQVLRRLNVSNRVQVAAIILSAAVAPKDYGSGVEKQ